MRTKNSTKLKIISILCFLIAAIISIANKEYVSSLVFIGMTISYSLIFFNQKKSNENK
ncbi:hypothetical protein LI034_05130 [Clostridium perfringens]|uniref:hypothetical protein n=1 Tax=Clostridium perfringens TaxID=1502 RepID=UPI0022478563|nr:hypothetical protein [Clostridium perfringens]MCX0360381.1 hypothetical protein [Clostridium perfringens]